jgi:cyclic-di-GMP phosphodiesterase TipF (flagellum assembly factor)
MSLFMGLAGFQAWRRSDNERETLSVELHRLEAEVVRLRANGPPRMDVRASRPVPALAPFAERDPFGLNIDTGIAPAGDNPAEPLIHGSLEDLRTEVWPEETQAALPDDGRVPDDEAAGPLSEQCGSAVREDDVEMLQRRIKEMLYQVSAAEQAREPATSPAEDYAAEQPPPVAAMGIEASLGALRAAAQSMRKPSEPMAPFERASAEPVPPPPLPAATGTEPPAEPRDRQLEAVREAIAAGRVDVYLEPILGLGDQSAQHYEVSIKLRGPGSEDLGQGEGEILPGLGLLPLFDTARIQRSAIVAERLVSRGKTGSVFARASGEALIAPDFTRDMQMDFVTRPATARQLVLTFTQADIRLFRAAEQRAVSALSALGFRFAISGLTDLDMNFAAMAKAGFGFVKLDATVLAEGLPHPGGNIPAHDVCRFLAEQGFGLIVEGIDSEETLARVYGFGCVLGQGLLFGGRRPVKADLIAKSGQAAA